MPFLGEIDDRIRRREDRLGRSIVTIKGDNAGWWRDCFGKSRILRTVAARNEIFGWWTPRTERIFNRKKRLAVSLCDKFQFHTFATI